jgi:hypothetical protein
MQKYIKPDARHQRLARLLSESIGERWLAVREMSDLEILVRKSNHFVYGIASYDRSGKPRHEEIDTDRLREIIGINVVAVSSKS